MAASLTTHSRFPLNAYSEEVISFVSDDSGDWIVLTCPGIICPTMNQTTGAAMAIAHGTFQVLNGGTAYTATTTSIVYDTDSPDSTTRLSGGYYIETTSGEYIYVLNDSAPTANTGTLTVVRGCLGTTASATGLATTNVLQIKNVIVTAADVNCRVIIRGVVLPTEYRTNMFTV